MLFETMLEVGKKVEQEGIQEDYHQANERVGRYEFTRRL